MQCQQSMQIFLAVTLSRVVQWISESKHKNETVNMALEAAEFRLQQIRDATVEDPCL